MKKIRDIIHTQDNSQQKNFEPQSASHYPECQDCDDSGVRLRHGEPELCHCIKAQSQEASILLRQTRQGNVSKLTWPKEQPAKKYSCLFCHDLGWMYAMGETKRCPCQQEADQVGREARQIRLCQLPKDTEHMTFKNFDIYEGNGDAIEFAGWIAWERLGLKYLTLLSESDHGKTHLSIAICREWLSRGRPARYCYVPKMLDDLRAGFDQEGQESFHAQYNALINVPLLVLDDLGVEKMTDWGIEKLNSIIHLRGVNGLYLVVTSNKSLEQLPPRISSRLQRESWCRVVTIGGPEHRLRE